MYVYFRDFRLCCTNVILQAPKSPATHSDENNSGGGFIDDGGSLNSHMGSKSVLSASDKALDAMYMNQSVESSDEEKSQEDEEEAVGNDEFDIPEEILEEDNDRSSSNHSGRSEGDDLVPADKMRDLGPGEMGEDGVFLEENEALLGNSKRSSERRRSSLFQTMVGNLGFVSFTDFENGGEDGSESEDDEEESIEGVQNHPKRRKSKKKKNKLFTDTIEGLDYNNSCFRAIKRAFLGEVRWSQIAYFPVVKYKLSDDDLDCNRGEITIRVLRSNRGKVLRGLDSGVRNMSLGETSQIKVRYDRAYSSFTLGSIVPPRANIVYTCELITINGNGRYGMPYRQLKRVGRFFWKIKEYCINSIERFYWRAKKRYHGVIDITGPPDSYYDQSEDDLSFASSVDSWTGFVEDEEEDKPIDPRTAGIAIGAKLMWGFAPEKRPVKKKKPKTEYEKLVARQQFLSEKKSKKAESRKREKMLLAQESAQADHDKLLNMGLGT